MAVWGKRNTEESTPKAPAVGPPAVTPPPRPAAPPASNPVEVKKESSPVSSMPNPSFRPPEPTSNSATIGKAVRINGDISSREDLYVDGDIEGTIELVEHKLTIGPNGKLQGSVKAREVVVLGTIHGNVEAQDRMEIRKEARLTGDIRTARVMIEDGAFFKGSIDIVRPEPAKTTANVKQQSAPAGSNAAASANPR